MPSTRTKRVVLTTRGWLGFGVTALGGTLVACGSADTFGLIANDVLTENQPFVAITRESTAAHLARLFLDAPITRGLFTADPILDSSLFAPLLTEIEGVLFNRDGIRSYRSRRAMVDILKKLQIDRAHRALREAKTALEASRATVPPNEAFDLDNLIARVERAISPYYN